MFPPRCPVCGQILEWPGQRVCPGCRKELSWVSPPVCFRCGKEVASEQTQYCPDCLKRRHTIEYGAALLNYNQAAARSMAQIKYENYREYLDFYSEAMAVRLGGRIRRMNAQVLVPVPVHPLRLRQRGFNQAWELAKRLSARLGIPADPGLLKRIRQTAPQKDLDPGQRLKNLEKAFCVDPRRQAAGRLPQSVILVDDIYTTGSTIEACARALKKAGISRIYFVTICIGGGR